MSYVRVFLGLAFIVLGCSVCQGQYVTVYVEGTVIDVSDYDDSLGGAIVVGDELTGTYTYALGADDTAASSEIGRYEYSTAPYGMNLAIKDYTFQTDPADVEFELEVGNSAMDHYLVRSRNNLPTKGNVPVGTIDWQLYDPAGEAISDDSLPTEPAHIYDWERPSYLMIEHHGYPEYVITVEVDYDVLITELVTVSLQANVTSVVDKYGVLGGKIHVGSDVSGTYRYALGAPDIEPGSAVGRYLYRTGAYGIGLSVGGLTFASQPSDTNLLIQTSNGKTDSILLESDRNLPVGKQGPVGRIACELQDSRGSAISDDSLPSTAPNLRAWERKELVIENNSGTPERDYTIRADVVSATQVIERVTVKVAGAVTSVVDEAGDLGGLIAVGDKIAGSYTYTLGRADTNASPNFGQYWYSDVHNGISLVVNGLVFEVDPNNMDFMVQVINKDFDSLFIRSLSNRDVLAGVGVDRVVCNFSDPNGTVLDNTMLPEGPPHLEDWPGLRRLEMVRLDPLYWIKAEVQSVGIECAHYPLGDYDRNCRVDFADIAVMLANWLVDCKQDPLDEACFP